MTQTTLCACKWLGMKRRPGGLPATYPSAATQKRLTKLRTLRTGMAGPLQVESAVAERPTGTHGRQTVQLIYDLVTELGSMPTKR